MKKDYLLDIFDDIGLNIYDTAMINDNGMRAKKLQPCNNCNNSYSVTKAFTMTAIGMLQDDGLLKVEDAVRKYLQFPNEYDSKWNYVTIEHALTHTIGFKSAFLDIDVEDVAEYPSEDYLNIILTHPLEHCPGTKYVYSDAAFYLLSHIVLKASGKELDDLLRERLIRPLGFKEIAWSKCPYGHAMGATGLYISSEDMVKLGWLYVNKGNWNGQQIVSAAWVHTVLEKSYEFKPIGNSGMYFKGGLFGQILIFDPEKRAAYAWHAHEENWNDKRLSEILPRIYQNEQPGEEKQQ